MMLGNKSVTKLALKIFAYLKSIFSQTYKTLDAFFTRMTGGRGFLPPCMSNENKTLFIYLFVYLFICNEHRTEVHTL